MNIMFLSIEEVSDIEDHGIYSDLLRQFRDNGHNVYIVNPREKRFNLPTEYYKKNGANILKVKIGNITKTNKFEKGVSMLRIDTLFYKAVRKFLQGINFNLIIYATPPITFDKVITYVKENSNAHSYLLLKDIFPQNAVDLGIINNNGLIYKYFKQKEKKLYKNSDFIGCMSQANVEYLLRNNAEIKSGKVEECPNSIEPIEIIKNQKIKEEFFDEYNIPKDKVIFVYGGNLGKPQGVDYLIECLRANKNNGDACFVIAGSGTEFQKLNDFFKTEKPGNAILLNQLPRLKYQRLVNECDVGLIFLDWRFTIPNFPSRLLSYMQASIPVLAATDANTDLGKIIERESFGLWCPSNNVEEFSKMVKTLCDKKLRESMGKNGRVYLEGNYTTKQSYEIIMKHFIS